MRPVRLALAAALAALAVGCAPALRPFPDRPPVWEDDDRRPFGPRPAPQRDMTLWDAADGVVFRQLERGLAVEHGEPAVNVNAFDEVPDSSWFVNRIGRVPAAPDVVAQGACPRGAAPRPPLAIVEAKPNGMQPGFIVRDADGQRWLLKADGEALGPRATSAEVVGAALLHAAGYHVPCNVIAWVEPGALTRDPDSAGAPSEAEVRSVIAAARRRADGRLRFAASRFFDAAPIGPWRYHGRWDADPNDRVAHEHRRELRALRVFCAWLDHMDVRAQNTLGLWVETGPDRGYVRHALIDFGDSLGARAEDPRWDRRMRHQTWFDPTAALEDLFTLGTLPRPWYRDDAELAPFASLALPFDPHRWVPHYWNGAFERMDEHDAAWAARIVARLTEEHLRAIAARAELQPGERRRLEHGLALRRRAILARYLIHMSPLAEPRIVDGRLCVEDLAVSSGLRRYRVDEARVAGRALPTSRDRARLCVPLPLGAGYHVVSVRSETPGRDSPFALRVHVRIDRRGARVLGLER